MGFGVAGVCWRGPSIFEGPKSKAVVSKWIGFYNKYRETLTTEMLIHVRRPDGQVSLSRIIMTETTHTHTHAQHNPTLTSHHVISD